MKPNKKYGGEKMIKTVKETLKDVKKKGMFSSKDFQNLILSLLTDEKHKTKICKLKDNKVVVLDKMVLANEFKNFVVDVMMKTGLSKEEAEKVAKDYKPKKSVANLFIKLHEEALDIYAHKYQKNVPLLIRENIHLTLDIGDKREKMVYSIGNKDKGIERKALYKAKKTSVRIKNRTLETMKIKI